VSIARSSRGGTSIQPSRQPVIEKYLEKELTTTAGGSTHADAVAGLPAKEMPWYTSSLISCTPLLSQ